MNLARLLVRAARTHPRSPAIFSGERLVSDYARFADRAARLAASFARDGIAPGERVALVMANSPEYLEVLYGAWMAGLAVVPVNAKLHPREVEYILRDSGAAIAFVSEGLEAPGATRLCTVGGAEYEARFAADPAAVAGREADDIAWLFYTSGTTGRPKGVMLTHRNLLAMTLCYFTDVDHVRREDATVYAAPMSHGAGLYNFAFVLAAARHVIPASGGFDAAELASLAAHHRNACLFAAPTIVKRLVDHVERSGADCSGFKTIVYGGGPMYVADIERALAVMGNRFVQIYGQGESPMTITALAREHLADRSHPRRAQRIGSVGVAQSAVEVRVATPEGRTLPAGEAGEVLVKGDTVMRGYWNNAEATAQAIRDGWLYTGDVGSLDADGFLTLRDRSKDVIISGGSNIYPREVEEVLLRHPAVSEVSVVGRPHPEWGEEVVAFVVVRGKSANPAELDALCLESIARFKRPKEYRFVDALPKNNYGKVLKTELRRLLESEAG